MTSRQAGRLILFLLAFGWRSAGVAAQCDVPAALLQMRQSGCLSAGESARLSQYLAGSLFEEEESKKRDALDMVSRAYRCALAKGNGLENYACFRRLLFEQFYGYFKDSDLCLVDRLTRSCVALRYVLEAKLPSSQPLQYQQILDRALNDIRLGVGICNEVKARPRDVSTLHLAERWCIDPSNPVLPLDYFQELLDSSADLSMEYPEAGRHMGSVLDVILRDALSLFDGDERSRALRDGYELLIAFDHADLAGSSFFYRFERKRREIAPEPELVSPAEVEGVLEELKKLEPYLEQGAQRLRHRSGAWKYFESYSDFLYTLAQPLQSYREYWGMRNSLLEASCKVLWRGIGFSVGSETAGQLNFVQEKLLDRVRSYGLELARELKYRRLVEFESQFLDQSARILPEKQQCYIHAHLAQALYVLGSNKESWEHLRKSCELVSLDDLRGLRDSIQPWMN